MSFSLIGGPDSYQAKHAWHWPIAALELLIQEPQLIVDVTFVGLLPSSQSSFCTYLERVFICNGGRGGISYAPFDVCFIYWSM
jgi:hypothetical protein